MRSHLKLNRLLVFLLVVFSISMLTLPLAAADKTRVTVDSPRSFEEVSDAVQKLVAQNDMMVMATVNQGKMLSMTGLTLNATLFLIGNPTVGKQLFEQSHEVGLYVPLRLFVYSDAAGTHISYDKPSALLAQFGNQKISQVAKMLDEKLVGLSRMAAGPAKPEGSHTQP